MDITMAASMLRRIKKRVWLKLNGWMDKYMIMAQKTIETEKKTNMRLVALLGLFR